MKSEANGFEGLEVLVALAGQSHECSHSGWLRVIWIEAIPNPLDLVEIVAGVAAGPRVSKIGSGLRAACLMKDGGDDLEPLRVFDIRRDAVENVFKLV